MVAENSSGSYLTIHTFHSFMAKNTTTHSGTRVFSFGRGGLDLNPLCEPRLAPF